jgi:hypothetical protein
MLRWCTLSNERTNLSFTTAADPRHRAVILRSESRGTQDHILLFQIRASPNLEGQVPVFTYIPHKEGSPVIPPGTGFPFRRLLQLAGLRWRYSNPALVIKSKSHCDWRSVSKSWCRAYLLRSCSCGAPSLTRGRVCLLYMLLALASVVFLGSESLVTRDHILLSQIWDSLFVASYDSQGHGGGIRPRLHTGLETRVSPTTLKYDASLAYFPYSEK